MKVAEHEAGRIRAWLADPLFTGILADMEQAAVNSAVWSKSGEHDRITAALAEVRAIRALLSKLNALARDEANPDSDDDPA